MTEGTALSLMMEAKSLETSIGRYPSFKVNDSSRKKKFQEAIIDLRKTDQLKLVNKNELLAHLQFLVQHMR